MALSFVLKFYPTETRIVRDTVCVDSLADFNFEALCQCAVRKLLPNEQTRKFMWKDEDDELICLENDDDLLEALRNMQSNNAGKGCLRIYPTVVANSHEPIVNESVAASQSGACAIQRIMAQQKSEFALLEVHHAETSLTADKAALTQSQRIFDLEQTNDSLQKEMEVLLAELDKLGNEDTETKAAVEQSTGEVCKAREDLSAAESENAALRASLNDSQLQYKLTSDERGQANTKLLQLSEKMVTARTDLLTHKKLSEDLQDELGRFSSLHDEIVLAMACFREMVSALEEAQVNSVVCKEYLAQLMPVIVALSRGGQWRAKVATIQYMPTLGGLLGQQFFDDHLRDLYLGWLTDDVNDVRKAAASSLRDLVDRFGYDWALETIIPMLRVLSNVSNYKLRITCLLAIGIVAEPCGTDVTHHYLLPLLQKLSEDPVRNVRINVAKTLREIVGVLGPKAVDSDAMPLLDKLVEDKAVDVRHFAEAARSALRLRASHVNEVSSNDNLSNSISMQSLRSGTTRPITPTMPSADGVSSNAAAPASFLQQSSNCS